MQRNTNNLTRRLGGGSGNKHWSASSAQFLFLKTQSECLPVSFDSSNAFSLSNSLSITSSELHSAIHKYLRNASPTYLLSLFNSILRQGTYPLPWKLAIILPILKPTEDLSLPSSYHPIALPLYWANFFRKFSFGPSNQMISSPPQNTASANAEIPFKL